MKYCLIAPLSGKASWVQQALAEWGKKITLWRKWEFIPVASSKLTDVSQKKREEGRHILKVISKEAPLVVFDERGKSFSSVQWANELQQLENRGSKSINFVVGGAYGLSDELLQQADLIVSMSPWVLNHQVALVVAAEQIYRALTLIHGHPYHHD